MAVQAWYVLAPLLTCALAACGEARTLSTERSSSPSGALGGCTRCHGGESVATQGTDPLIGVAPPRAVSGRPDDPAIGAHQLHLTDHVRAGQRFRAVACSTCHLLPTSVAHPRQEQGKLTFSGMAVAAWPGETAPLPTWSPGSGSCGATYCHGGFRGGNAGNAPVWAQARAESCGTCHGDPATRLALPVAGHAALAPGATNGTCAVCHADTVDPDGNLLPGGMHLDGELQTDPAARHPAGWLDAGSPEFHGSAAVHGVQACQRCHAAQAPARVTATTCADCHGEAGAVSCSSCHGSAANAAPPRDTTGNTVTTAVGVGAHQAHVAAPGGLSAPFDCVFCHVRPSALFDPGHLDGQVGVTSYTGSDPVWAAAATDPGWSRPTASCSTSYCHGAFPGGNGANAPVWTQTGQAACGTCHALPPADGPLVQGVPAHRFHVIRVGLRDCGTCHLGYGATSVDPAQHVNARREVTYLDGTTMVGWDCGTCHDRFPPMP